VLHGVLRVQSLIDSLIQNALFNGGFKVRLQFISTLCSFSCSTLNLSPIRTANSACIVYSIKKKQISLCQCVIWFRNSNRTENCPFCIRISLRFVDGLGLQFSSVTELDCQSISKVLWKTSCSSLFRTGWSLVRFFIVKKKKNLVRFVSGVDREGILTPT